MHWVTVDGRVMPKLVGGHQALDLCNTYAGWGGPPHPKAEWLPDPEAMLVWCGHAGLLDASTTASLREEATARPGEACEALEAVRGLRGDLYRVLVADDEKAFRRVAGVAERSARGARLVRQQDGGARWLLPRDLGLDLPLLSLASRAAELLVGQDRRKVGVCPGDDCGWLFLDRRGNRRWCSMETCGNKAKARAFAARRRGNGPATSRRP